jgi:hypothetical protein
MPTGGITVMVGLDLMGPPEPLVRRVASFLGPEDRLVLVHGPEHRHDVLGVGWELIADVEPRRRDGRSGNGCLFFSRRMRA